MIALCMQSPRRNRGLICCFIKHDLGLARYSLDQIAAVSVGWMVSDISDLWCVLGWATLLGWRGKVW
jgi:ABC-type oligopeptide transport system ATPase subunit